MKLLKYFKTKTIIAMLLLATVAIAAGGIPITRTTGINTNMVINDQIRVIAQPYLTAILEGDIPGHTFATIEGNNPQVNTEASVGEQIIWGVAPGDQAQYVYPSAATTIDIVSTDADDNASGNGAQEVTIWGLDTNYEQISEAIDTHATDGTIAVTTTSEFLRVNSVEVTEAGSTASNEGDITVLDGANILSFVEEGTNKAIVAVYTVPADMTLFVENAKGTGAGTKNVHIHVYKRLFGGLFTQEKHRTINDSPFEMTTFRFPEKTDIEGRCHSDVNGGITDLSMEGWLESE